MAGTKLLAGAPSGLLTTAGLVGGFAAARASKDRRLGGAIWALAGLACIPRWKRAGRWRAALLGLGYAGAMGGSHPLAKKIGAWPAVALVSLAMAVLASLVAPHGPALSSDAGRPPSRFR